MEDDDDVEGIKTEEITPIEDLYKTEGFMDRFNEQYGLIKEYRNSHMNAPVDTMGCAALVDSGVDEKTRRFQSLVSLMLSSQTKDEITARAVNNLKKNNACSVEEMDKLTEEEIQKLIYPVGFYKRKATYLKKTCKLLKDKFAGDVPRTVEELKSLPGVGPKMAFLCMSIMGETVGIGVDTHVHRISNWLQWVNTKNPEETRKQLEKFVPKEEWFVINHMLVGFGQTMCKPVAPKCSECPLSSSCHHYQTVVSEKQQQKKKVKKEEEEEEMEVLVEVEEED